MSMSKNIKKSIIYLENKIEINHLTEEDIISKIESIKSKLNLGDINFSKLSTIKLKENGKTRIIKQYDENSINENILCNAIKYTVQDSFNIKYPNRNKVSREVFNYIRSIQSKEEFTIIKFDFSNYFNSIATEYVYKKIIKNNLVNRDEVELLEKFSKETKYCYAGLPTSNIFAEIISLEFDKELLKSLYDYGVIFYERYIDDGLIILNSHIDKDVISDLLEDLVRKVYKDKSVDSSFICTTKLNDSKFKYISKSNLTNDSFGFLGYKFSLKKTSVKVEIKYGITKEKINKYKKKIENIINEYSKSPCKYKTELLRFRILAFTHRSVYLSNNSQWKVKGFISNYCELRYMEDKMIDKETLDFLENVILSSFDKLGVEYPYFLKGKKEKKNKYCLKYTIKQSNSLIFDHRIGYSKSSLVKICKSIKIAKTKLDGKDKNYEELTRDFLIKVKLGY